MNIQHLKYAVEVKKTGSISQAAENLYMGQPNLSKAIKELETTVGIPIFKRTSKGVVPTEKGEEFFVYANNILNQYNDMISLNKNSNNVQSFSISVPRGSYITNAFTRFVRTLDNSKEIDINFYETNSMNAIRNITEKGFHLGIIRYQTKYERYFLDYLKKNDCDYEKIYEFEYIILMSKSHPLAKTKEVCYFDLKNYIEIVHGDKSIPYLSKKSNITGKKDKRKISVYERGSQFDLLTHIPSTYMWVSPVPLETLDLYKLTQRKCNMQDNKYKDILMYPKWYKLNQLDRVFIGKLHEVKEEIASKEYL